MPATTLQLRWPENFPLCAVATLQINPAPEILFAGAQHRVVAPAPLFLTTRGTTWHCFRSIALGKIESAAGLKIYQELSFPRLRRHEQPPHREPTETKLQLALGFSQHRHRAESPPVPGNGLY